MPSLPPKFSLRPLGAKQIPPRLRLLLIQQSMILHKRQTHLLHDLDRRRHRLLEMRRRAFTLPELLVHGDLFEGGVEGVIVDLAEEDALTTVASMLFEELGEMVADGALDGLGLVGAEFEGGHALEGLRGEPVDAHDFVFEEGEGGTGDVFAVDLAPVFGFHGFKGDVGILLFADLRLHGFEMPAASAVDEGFFENGWGVDAEREKEVAHGTVGERAVPAGVADDPGVDCGGDGIEGFELLGRVDEVFGFKEVGKFEGDAVVGINHVGEGFGEVLVIGLCGVGVSLSRELFGDALGHGENVDMRASPVRTSLAHGHKESPLGNLVEFHHICNADAGGTVAGMKVSGAGMEPFVRERRAKPPGAGTEKVAVEMKAIVQDVDLDVGGHANVVGADVDGGVVAAGGHRLGHGGFGGFGGGAGGDFPVWDFAIFEVLSGLCRRAGRCFFRDDNHAREQLLARSLLLAHLRIHIFLHRLRARSLIEDLPKLWHLDLVCHPQL